MEKAPSDFKIIVTCFYEVNPKEPKIQQIVSTK